MLPKIVPDFHPIVRITASILEQHADLRPEFVMLRKLATVSVPVAHQMHLEPGYPAVHLRGCVMYLNRVVAPVRTAQPIYFFHPERHAGLQQIYVMWLKTVPGLLQSARRIFTDRVFQPVGPLPEFAMLPKTVPDFQPVVL